MIFLTKKKKEGGWARLFTVVENCNGSLLFSSWVQCHVIWVVFSKFHPPTKKQTNNKIQIQTYTVFTHSSCVNTKTYRCAHIHTHKAPSRTKAYTDIKGPLFSPSYRYSTGGFMLCASTSLSLCVCERVWHNVWGELLQTPSAYRAARVCVHGHSGFVWTTEKKQQFHQQCSQKQNNCAFDGVCLWWWGDRKWDHAEGSDCVRGRLIEEPGKARSRIPITY